ncbi:MAG: ribulose-phosphate 3-epimerase [Clostridia bacterium]|nr:ribulose-phosphate 3-epimerase [Clostridia bacterium]
MDKLFMPSMMCVDPAKLCETLDVFEKNGIGGLHIDVMDGHFVPNLQLGTDYCRHLHRLSKLPLDFHLMITEPEDKIAWFPIQEGDWVSVHAESTNHLQRTFDRILAAGGKPMVALNPATPLCMAEEVLEQAAGVLLMTVSPGYAGQKLVESTIGKISRLRKMLDERGLNHVRIEVDGNVSPANLVRMDAAGADMYVIGSSGFLKSSDADEIAAGIAEFRKTVG